MVHLELLDTMTERPTLWHLLGAVPVVVAGCGGSSEAGPEHAALGAGGDGGEKPDAAAGAGANTGAAGALVTDGGPPLEAGLPEGPPPTYCIPPCLWELYVRCKVPGAGAPPPSPATCVREPFGCDDPTYCSRLCVPGDGFAAQAFPGYHFKVAQSTGVPYPLARPYDEGSLTFYVDGQFCARVAIGSGGLPQAGLTLVLWSDIPVGEHGPSLATSTAPEIFAASYDWTREIGCRADSEGLTSDWYEYRPESPDCAPWASAMQLLNPLVNPGCTDAPAGTCPAELFP